LQRQQRTLWRLVGSLVRLSIELGLHHDPTTQINPVTETNTFTEEECQLRIRLWGIVLVHDRGTSILLGRPLAIAPSDANTPRPSRPKNGPAEFSEHFELSHPIAEIQADIIISLYSPSRQSGDTIMRNATRIIKSMQEFRRGLPEKYKHYFGGTDEWPLERKSKLVQDITEDVGLTLLKIGISRILLLRALFSLKELSYPQRRRALVDGKHVVSLFAGAFFLTRCRSYRHLPQHYYCPQSADTFPRYRIFHFPNSTSHCSHGHSLWPHVEM